MISSHSFRFLTPAFPHGAYQAMKDNIPELRAPSIRGQLRWWWRNLGYQSEGELFGSTSGNQGAASKIQIRLHAPEEVHLCTAEILPHKDAANRRGPKNAIQEKKDLFTLELRSIRGLLDDSIREQLENTVKAWLLMGAVGQRANRSAGSIWPEQNAPSSPSEYLACCRRLLQQSRMKIALLQTGPMSSREIRDLSGRFLGGSNTNVPGNVFGSATPRKSSSVKLRAVRFDEKLHLAALWCPKNPEDTPDNLHRALMNMEQMDAKKDLAALLIDALPDLCP
jgi:CRISPR type III-B/RAMP module RAMP protein Cmr1